MIKKIYNANKGRYGYRRITMQLRADGIIINHKTVQKLMVEMGLYAMMENFFDLMKSELLYVQEWDSIEQFKKELVKYIRYYNNDRIKLRLN